MCRKFKKLDSDTGPLNESERTPITDTSPRPTFSRRDYSATLR